MVSRPKLINETVKPKAKRKAEGEVMALTKETVTAV